MPELKLHAQDDFNETSVDAASAILEWAFTRETPGYVDTRDCPDLRTISATEIFEATHELIDSGYIRAEFDGGGRYPQVALLPAAKREIQRGIAMWNEPGRAQRELTQLLLTIAYQSHTEDDGIILMAPPVVREGRVIQPTDRQHQSAAQWLASCGYLSIERNNDGRITQGSLTTLGIEAAESPMNLHQYDQQRRGGPDAPVHVRGEGSGKRARHQ